MTFPSLRRPRRGRPSVSARPFAAALLVATAPAAAQVTFGGQVRPRFEVLDRDDRTDALTSMRTRAWLDAAPAPDVRVFIQLQDVRVWGEESSTLGDFRADALDLHQGFVEVGHEGRSTLWSRIGRQEVALGGERLVGAVDWTQQARAFDGVRGALQGGRLRVDLFGFQLAEERVSAVDALFAGGYGAVDLGPAGELGLYVLHDRDATGQRRRPLHPRRALGRRPRPLVLRGGGLGRPAAPAAWTWAPGS